MNHQNNITTKESKAKKVLNFYVTTNKLKSLIRTGWLKWHVNAERLESVAEHIYGVQMLAIAMYSEYEYNLDITKVIYMLAIHELEETIIGDLTYFEINDEEKNIIGHKAIEEILKELLNSDQIKQLIYEFDERKTKEALFAYHCDKLECDIQCKLYDEAGYVNPFDQGENPDHNQEIIKKLKNGEITWSEAWLNHDRPKYNDDANFMEVLNYTKNNPITTRSSLNV